MSLTNGTQNVGNLRISIECEVRTETIDGARHLEGFGIYHDTPWIKVLRDAFNWKVGAVTAHRGERLVALLPFVRKRRLGKLIHVCLPLSHDATVLVSPDAETTLYAILDAMIARVDPLELHGPLPDGPITEINNAESIESTIDLTKHSTIDSLFAGMASSHRRKVRRAEREGVVVRKINTLDGFRIFARLQSLTRRRQGALDYPDQFFPAIATHLAAHGKAELSLGYFDARPVAGIVMFIDDDQSRAIYGYGASVEDRDVLATGVNPFLMWQAIMQAHSDGLKTFSFGSTAAHHQSLLTYKGRFGASVRPLVRQRYSAKSVPVVMEGGFLNRFASPLMRAMPLWAFRAITPRILAEVV